MHRLRNMPIKLKLTLIMLLTSGMALLLASVAFVAYEFLALREGLVADLSSTAKMVGYNSASALSFNDPASAAETLKSLAMNPHVVGGAIYDKNGKLFASYRQASSKESFKPSADEPDGHRFVDPGLQLFRGIDLAGEHTGMVCIEANLNQIYARLWRYALILIVVMAFALFITYLLAARLRTVISGPISHLAGVVGVVAREKDYSVRAVKHGEDEMGQLIDGFNYMLNQIQAQNNALQEARGNLEKRVQERTAELSAEVIERRRVEQSLRQSETRFREIADNAAEWIWEVNAEGLYTYASPVVERILGYTPEELVGKKYFYDLFAPAARESMKKAVLEGFARKERVSNFVNPNVHKDGRVVVLETSGVPILDDRGNLRGYLGSDIDVTQRVRAQADLEAVQRELMNASREAGMAEIASNVLHNVGNTLNSANVSLTLVSDSVENSKVSSLAKVVALLREHEGDPGRFIASDPRGRQIPAFLGQLSENLLADQKTTLHELDLLRGYIKHIIEIVAMQQNYATVSGVREVVDISSLVEDSLRMNAGALSRHGVEIVREYGNVPPMNLDKHRILQILVNLVRNAKHACEDSGRVDRRLTLRVAGGDGRVRISVVDNGVGIPPENVTRIFNHGFTTRKGGHGFGLHSSALAAQEMGGSLTVHSDGQGQGAAFTLELPYETKETAHE
ncbi:MAG: hypothetical protein C0404_10965 [Verrucomicrobia bacterium]|nr:hypothetical protein [Verrucomicrobiota bacterium]